MSTFEDIRYTRQANFDIGTKEVIDFEFDMPKRYMEIAIYLFLLMIIAMQIACFVLHNFGMKTGV